jgi:hypothetical protein
MAKFKNLLKTAEMKTEKRVGREAFGKSSGEVKCG